jgi:hypothetical protein
MHRVGRIMGIVVASTLDPVAVYPRDLAVASQQGRAVADRRDLAVASQQGRAVVYRRDLAAASQRDHAVASQQDPADRTADRIHPARVCRSFRRLGRDASSPHPASLCPLLQRHQNTPVTGQRCAGLSPRLPHRKH